MFDQNKKPCNPFSAYWQTKARLTQTPSPPHPSAVLPGCNLSPHWLWALCSSLPLVLPLYRFFTVYFSLLSLHARPFPAVICCTILMDGLCHEVLLFSLSFLPLKQHRSNRWRQSRISPLVMSAHSPWWASDGMHSHSSLWVSLPDQSIGFSRMENKYND